MVSSPASDRPHRAAAHPEPPRTAHAGSAGRGIYVRDSTEITVKLLVVGPYGVGKTTLIGQVSEITPLRTEEVVTQAGAVVDDLTGIRDKSHTTVAMDFGRLTLSGDLVLYLFGAPGQQRFLPVVSDLARGAYGALVLADSRRLDQSFESLSLIEDHRIPYAVALNQFPDALAYPAAEIREALDLHPGTPLVACDARDRTSATQALIALVSYLYALTQEHA